MFKLLKLAVIQCLFLYTGSEVFAKFSCSQLVLVPNTHKYFMTLLIFMSTWIIVITHQIIANFSYVLMVA